MNNGSEIPEELLEIRMLTQEETRNLSESGA